MNNLFYTIACYILGVLMGWILVSCSPSLPVATKSIGTVIEVDGDRVLVTFPVVNKNFSDQAANWFYIPGHSYQVRDRYPDSEKDPSLSQTHTANPKENQL